MAGPRLHDASAGLESHAGVATQRLKPFLHAEFPT